MRIMVSDLTEKALDLRRKIVKTAYLGRSGHITSSLSSLDIMIALYFGNILKYDVKNPSYHDRDRFILSKGHAALALYVILCEAGFFSWEDLNTYCKPGTIFGGHPTPSVAGVECATGALGHGLSFGVGLALSACLKKKPHLIYVITGDGECQEGSIWEAAMSISKYNLTNLIWIIDYNKLQATGTIDETMPLSDLNAKLNAFGFDVRSIDGHNYPELLHCLKISRDHLPQKPLVIIADTVKGKGIPFIENSKEWHSKIPNVEEFKIIAEQLGITWEEFEAL